jgi:hypothetical protein
MFSPLTDLHITAMNNEQNISEKSNNMKIHLNYKKKLIKMLINSL